uniref:Uncharacterized protein n=1 Tax=Anopheles farauti TaxID=69004 RepID=A0A182Q3B9_9DIPT
MASMLTAGSATAGSAADAAGGQQQSQSPQSLSSSSPRNTAAAGANAAGQPAGGGATAAVATNNPTAVKLGVMDVPKALQDGEKFIKWDERRAREWNRCAKKRKIIVNGNSERFPSGRSVDTNWRPFGWYTIPG